MPPTEPSLPALSRALERLSPEGRQQLAQWLDTHHPPESGEPMHQVTGRLVFQDWKPGITPAPLHHFSLQVRERHALGGSVLLAEGESDLDGAFVLSFAAPAHTRHPVELRVVEQQEVFGPHGEATWQPHEVHTVQLGQDLAATIELGTIAVPYWPYTYDSPLPRVLVPTGAEPPQDYARGRKTALLKTMAEYGLIRTRHQVAHKLSAHLPHLTTIQRDYPENRTLHLEKQSPGLTRSDAYFVDRLLNGLNPCLPVGDTRYPGEWRVGFNWDACEMDGVHTLPNADAWFVPDGETLRLTRLRIQLREPGATAPFGPLQPERLLTPADGADWQRAKRLFRCAWVLHGQIVAHLADSHLNVEQYAVAAYRNLRRSPLRRLLFPHLKEVAVINHGGSDLIFGERGYVSAASALTSRAVDALFVEALGRLDWKGWEPRRPLVPQHTFAQAARLYWEVLTRHVAEFLETHREAILANWPELRRMSDDMVRHSVPAVPPLQVPHDVVLDAGERGDVTSPRAVIDGVTRAVRPLTQTDAPAAGEWDDLAQWCRYVIYHATFFHAWANDRQHDDGGELRYAALSLREGGWGDEADEAIAQSPMEATDQLFWAMFLQHTGYGYILQNEDHDIPHRFVELLGERADAFRAVGFEPNTIRSRINI
ncbi:MAG: hypothetical protein VKP62_12440 [Candidatus Sericytochromatia bacterium]|nr:hypothetical protein [Candidatus Sericytochromatia bacterium]